MHNIENTAHLVQFISLQPLSIRVIDPAEPDSIRWRSREKEPVVYRIGETELQSLKYNTAGDVITEALDHQSIRGVSAKGATADIQIGVLARLLSRDGTVLAEYSDIDHDYPQITWQQLEARRGSETAVAGEGELLESVAAR